ncbi:MAG: hypothetical protein JWM20_639 [Patescibacteria group bacterium]|nr:hypothetical protein [Patescibacteria group bacterium]
MNTNPLKEKISHVVQSNGFRRFIIGILGLILVAIIFQAGVTVGFRKASFGKNFDNHYEENFGPMHQGIGGPRIPNPNGAAGKIISANGSLISVLEKNNSEKSVAITDETQIRFMHQEGTASELVPGTFIVAIGDPNAQGQIVAKFIRIIPAPPTQR